MFALKRIGCVPYNYSRGEIHKRLTFIVKCCPFNIIKMEGEIKIDLSLIKDVLKGLKKLIALTKIIFENDNTIGSTEYNTLFICGVYFLNFLWDYSYISLSWEGRKTRERYTEATRVLRYIIMNSEKENHDKILDTTINYMLLGQLWRKPVIAKDIFHIYLRAGIPNNTVFNKIFNVVETHINTDKTISKEFLLTAFLIFEENEWHKNVKHDYLKFLDTFYDMFISSVINENYKFLCRGISECLRRICFRLTNDELMHFIKTMIDAVFQHRLDKCDVLEFCNCLEYAAKLYKINEYTDLESCDIFQMTLDLIASSNCVLSLFGSRLVQYFLDRNENRQKLISPIIFFQNMNFGLKVSHPKSSDILFIDKYKDVMFHSIITAITQHCKISSNICEMFSCIVMISLEVPCGLTAAWTAWIALKIQEHGLKGASLTNATRHSLHAIAISTLSVVCWVHNAEIMYEHIGKIAENRAKQAPHLSPPIRNSYTYTQYHVTWDKPELFIDEWELRYGLWKTFNVLNKDKGSASSKKTDKSYDEFDIPHIDYGSSFLW